MKLYENKNYLWKRIIVDGKTLAEVAKENGVNERTIRRWAKEYGIIR